MSGTTIINNNPGGGKPSRFLSKQIIIYAVVILIAILSAVFLFRTGDADEFTVELGNSSFSLRKYTDSLESIESKHLWEIEELRKEIEELKSRVQNPYQRERIEERLLALLIEREKHLEKGKSLLEELHLFKKMTVEEKTDVINRVMAFLGGDENPIFLKNYAVVANEIVHGDAIRQKDSIIFAQQMEIVGLKGEIRSLKSQVDDLTNTVAALGYELEQYKKKTRSKQQEVSMIREDRNRLQERYNDLLLKFRHFNENNHEPDGSSSRDMKEILAQLEKLEMENKDILQENRNYQETLREKSELIEQWISIDSPLFFPMKASRRKNDHSYRVNQFKHIGFFFEANSRRENSLGKKKRLTIKFGIPIDESTYDWITKDIEVELGKKEGVYLFEGELSEDSSGKRYKFSRGVYYVRILYPDMPTAGEICKLEFVAR